MWFDVTSVSIRSSSRCTWKSTIVKFQSRISVHFCVAMHFDVVAVSRLAAVSAAIGVGGRVMLAVAIRKESTLSHSFARCTTVTAANAVPIFESV